MIGEIIKDLDVTIKEKKANIEAAILPVVEGNPIRLRQLFTNLLGNALKYSKKDVTPHINIRAENSNNHVAIKVKDNGIGFEEEYKEKIFGLFERLHTRGQYPGTGIGLSICKRIAELHHGSISAISTLGEYAEFNVTLPITQEIKPVPI